MFLFVFFACFAKKIENLPQFFIQLLYIMTSGSQFNEVAFISMTFSILSILLAVMLRVTDCRFQTTIKSQYHYKARILGEYQINCDKIHQ